MQIPFFGRKNKREVEREPSVPGFVHYSSSKKPDRKAMAAVEMRKRNSKSFVNRVKALKSTLNPSAPSIDVDLNLGRLLLLFPLAAVLGVIAFGFYLHENKVFVISSVEIFGNEEISDLQIIGSIGDMKGKSMFDIVGADIESALLAEFPYIKNVYVDKKLPGEIQITIQERFPEFAYLNLSGAYLVDSDDIVVEVLGIEDVSEFNERENLILEGLGDPNADYVLAEYISAIEDEEVLQNLNWDEVPGEEKAQTLESIRLELEARRVGLIQSKTDFINRAGFSSLEQAIGYDADRYQIGDKFPPKIREYTLGIDSFLAEEGLDAKNITWKTGFTIDTYLGGGLRVLFTSTRPLLPQFEAFQTVRTAEGISNARKIDVRSEIVSVQ